MMGKIFNLVIVNLLIEDLPRAIELTLSHQCI